VGGLASTGNALLAVALVVGGMLMPFVFTVAALRHVPAPGVAVIATLEPVLAAVFAWHYPRRGLGRGAYGGRMIVLVAVAWVQTRRSDLEAESAPRRRREARFSPR
jgi:drug/metabolite transporter (DMT)-like permease